MRRVSHKAGILSNGEVDFAAGVAIPPGMMKYRRAYEEAPCSQLSAA